LVIVNTIGFKLKVDSILLLVRSAELTTKRIKQLSRQLSIFLVLLFMFQLVRI